MKEISIALASLLMLAMVAGPDNGQTVEVPPWATQKWQEFAAGIVAGEAADTEAARLAVACTLIADVERGWNPWALRQRWYGFRSPTHKSRSAVTRALYTSACQEMPRCSYVGNLRDLQLWRANGMARESTATVWIDQHGQATVCVHQKEGGEIGR